MKNSLMMVDIFEFSFQGYPLSDLNGEFYAQFTKEVPTIKEFGFLYGRTLTELSSVEKLMIYAELLYLGLIEFPIASDSMIEEVEYLWKI